jgi:Ca-activated chloride channel family protein
MIAIARLLVAGLVLAGLGAPQQQQPRPVFQSGAKTVALYATVRSPDGRLVPDLPREAFTVLDNGRQTELTFFSSDPQPLTVALLIDMSGSMDRHFLRVRAATREFIKALQPIDRVRIGTFSDEVALSPHLTGDKALLTRVLEEETWPLGGTPMWSAAYEAMRSLDGEAGRRVILILTDGIDNGKMFEHTIDDVERRATTEGFMVYGIGMEGTGLDVGIRNMADDTGGGYFELKAGDDLASTFARVIDELRHQYVLGFTPAALDGRRHHLEVKLSSPGLKARARRSYVAARDASGK